MKIHKNIYSCLMSLAVLVMLMGFIQTGSAQQKLDSYYPYFKVKLCGKGNCGKKGHGIHFNRTVQLRCTVDGNYKQLVDTHTIKPNKTVQFCPRKNNFCILPAQLLKATVRKNMPSYEGCYLTISRTNIYMPKKEVGGLNNKNKQTLEIYNDRPDGVTKMNWQWVAHS